jgi:hypothetical protein
MTSLGQFGNRGSNYTHEAMPTSFVPGHNAQNIAWIFASFPLAYLSLYSG